MANGYNTTGRTGGTNGTGRTGGTNGTGRTGGTGGNGQNGNGNGQGKDQGQGRGNNQSQRGDSSPETKVTEVRQTRPRQEGANTGQKRGTSGWNDYGDIELWVETEDKEILDDCIEPEDPRYQPSPRPQDDDIRTKDPNRPEIKRGPQTPIVTEEEVPDDFNGSWYKNDCGNCCGPTDTPSGATTSYMMTNTTISWDKNLTGNLLRGNWSALLKPEYSGKFETQSKSARDHSGAGTYKKGKATFSYKFNFTTPEGSMDVTAFTYTSYDMQKMMQNFDMGFKTNFSNLANVPKGPVTVEHILVNGSPPTKAYVNTSQGSSVSVPNITMKDEAFIDMLKGVKINISPITPELNKVSTSLSADKLAIDVPENILLDLSATVDNDGRAIISFDIDIARALSVRSQYGSVLKNDLDAPTHNRIIGLSSVDNIEVFRRKESTGEEILIAQSSQPSPSRPIKKNTSSTSLFPREASKLRGKIDTTKDFSLGTIEEHSIYEKDNIRTFVITDHSFASEPLGVSYIYGIKIGLKDGIKEVLLEKQQGLLLASTALKSLTTHKLSPNFVNSVTGRFTDSYRKKNKGATAVLNDAIATYIDTLVSVTSGVDKNNTASILYSFANPVSGTPDDVSKVLELFSSLEAELATKLPSTTISQSGFEESTLRYSDNFFKNRIEINHMFDSRPLSISNSKPRYVSDMKSPVTGFSTITSQQYAGMLKASMADGYAPGSISLQLIDQESLSNIERAGGLGVTFETGVQNIDNDKTGLQEATEFLSRDNVFTKGTTAISDKQESSPDAWLENVAGCLVSSIYEAPLSNIAGKVEYHSYKNSAMGTKITSWQPLTPSMASRSKNKVFRCRIKTDEATIYNHIFILGSKMSNSSKTDKSSTKTSVLQYLGASTEAIGLLASAGEVNTNTAEAKTKRRSNTRFF